MVGGAAEEQKPLLHGVGVVVRRVGAAHAHVPERAEHRSHVPGAVRVAVGILTCGAVEQHAARLDRHQHPSSDRMVGRFIDSSSRVQLVGSEG